MFSVNTNTGAMAALQSLGATQKALEETQSRISTGKKVSQATDSPAVYTISRTMDGTLAGLSAVSDNLNFAQSVIGTSLDAADKISEQLSSLKKLVTTGQQTGIDTTTVNNQIGAVLKAIDSFAASASLNGVNLANGGGANMTTTTDVSGGTLTVNAENMTSSGLSLTGLNVSSGGLRLNIDSTTEFAQNDYIKLGDGTDSTYFVLSDGSGAPTAPAASDAHNKVVFVNFETTDSTATVMSKLSSAMREEGYGASIATSAIDGGAGADITAGDLVVTGKGVTSAGSAVTLATAGTATLAAVTGSTAAIATVDNAISALNSSIAKLGQNSQLVTGLQNYTSSLSDSLTTGLGALTDADMAAESARLQSLQTKQQLGIQALSIANQAPQSLLKLFQ
ncbi:Flagellin protein FlaA [Rhodovastum atsumiense]|uniref:Flagellin n=1 Tax=Rhodovastum atsumiense TaxID=504468 RepID=A0A5M6IVV2_9PROT|nr:flagellin [Rhodovastum atsumiense]KAA5612463.1 hypothetical protein F1189_09825 [Rhodovastum atsumiense]CAH2600375.1 Flagellin protein FlaA [Rhodovastum atsumiense]